MIQPIVEGVGEVEAVPVLLRRLAIYYHEPADQPEFAARINLRRTHERSRSFRKLVKDYRLLLLALGLAPDHWPAGGPENP
jgi:hypothetical protein